jgi:hypothetical protein
VEDNLLNTQLVDSLVQVILALPIAERASLEAKLEAKLTVAAREAEPSENPWTEEAIEDFLALGQHAVPGRLKNTSINHDRYLYGKPE